MVWTADMHVSLFILHWVPAYTDVFKHKIYVTRTLADLRGHAGAETINSI